MSREISNGSNQKYISVGKLTKETEDPIEQIELSVSNNTPTSSYNLNRSELEVDVEGHTTDLKLKIVKKPTKSGRYATLT